MSGVFTIILDYSYYDCSTDLDCLFLKLRVLGKYVETVQDLIQHAEKELFARGRNVPYWVQLPREHGTAGTVKSFYMC